jgi:RNA polymerase sigma-70 factor, ECF subfamily
MVTTSVSLLCRLRQTGDSEAWARFVDLYTPAIYFWVCRIGVPTDDASDLVQEVFILLMKKLPEFQYDRRRSFGAWLRVMTENRCRDYLRRRRPDRPGTDFPEPGVPDNTELFSESEYRQQIASRALQLMRAEFQPTTWKACWEHTVMGRPAEDISRELGISVNAVYVGKSRVLRRLREELTDLLE